MFCIISCQNKGNDKIPATGQKEEGITTQSDFNYSSLIGKDFLLDDQHSYIGFKIKYFGYSPVRGRFNDFDGTLFYDPGNTGNLSVSVFIDVASINTGNERRRRTR